mgnify:FL=1
MAVLVFDSVTKRDNVASAISTKLISYPMFEAILVPSLDELGRPQLTIDLRTNKDIDGNDILSWAKDQLSKVSVRPIAGSLSVHNCSHDEIFKPCVFSNIVSWP